MSVDQMDYLTSANASFNILLKNIHVKFKHYKRKNENEKHRIKLHTMILCIAYDLAILNFFTPFLSKY